MSSYDWSRYTDQNLYDFINSRNARGPGYSGGFRYGEPFRTAATAELDRRGSANTQTAQPQQQSNSRRTPQEQTIENITGAINSGNIGQIVAEQLRMFNDTQAKSEQDRAQALALLQSFGNRVNPYQGQIDSTIAGLQDLSQFDQGIQAQIEHILNNPAFGVREESALRDNAQRTQQGLFADQSRAARAQLAARGLGDSGFVTAQDDEYRQQAARNLLGAENEIALQKALANRQAQEKAIELGSSYQGQRDQKANALLGNLSNLFSTSQTLDQDLQVALAQILANTQRQSPDLSGFAALGLQSRDSAANNSLQAQINALQSMLNFGGGQYGQGIYGPNIYPPVGSNRSTRIPVYGSTGVRIGSRLVR